MDQRSKALFLSFLTVILVVLTLIIFIYNGASVLFYALAVTAFIVGMINFWMVESEEERPVNLFASTNKTNKKTNKRKESRNDRSRR